ALHVLQHLRSQPGDRPRLVPRLTSGPPRRRLEPDRDHPLGPLDHHLLRLQRRARRLPRPLGLALANQAVSARASMRPASAPRSTTARDGGAPRTTASAAARPISIAVSMKT